MNFVFFVHSIVSDWNHGNAHFLRGLMAALVRRGHRVRSCEPRRGWSLDNLVSDHGPGPVVEFARAFPGIEVRGHSAESAPDEGRLLDELRSATEGADVVVVHEWNAPSVANGLGRLRREEASFRLLFHDTHHRPYSAPEQIARLDLAAYDGVLAFGEVLRRIYLDRFHVRRAWTLHEAADVARFRPLEREKTHDVVWIGNWGDGERAGELRSYWLESARALPDLSFVAHGVRYPPEARDALERAGVDFRGWAPSLDVPEIFATARATLHIPRRAYVEALRGIPTIRVFEALACGIPLVCSPWLDAEGLFRPGDYRVAHTPARMRETLRRIVADAPAAAEQAARGRETVLARHTCDHRAAELLAILGELGAAEAAEPDALNRETACA